MTKTAAPAPVLIPVQGVTISGDLRVPAEARGLVIFAHGSGSSRHSTRNIFVAESLGHQGFATLLMDLLTPDEERVDQRTGHLRFDVEMLGRRVAEIVDWAAEARDVSMLPIGLFGASTGAAAALIAASRRPGAVRAVVSRGGRPDLAGPALARVTAPTLLLVGGLDDIVIELNHQARERMKNAEAVLEIIPGAGHLFEESGTLTVVADRATMWFERYLRAERGRDVDAQLVRRK
jgi:pimeloyl-ACP methyl ester carboxylesterase